MSEEIWGEDSTDFAKPQMNNSVRINYLNVFFFFAQNYSIYSSNEYKEVIICYVYKQFEEGRAPRHGKGRGTIPYNNNDREYAARQSGFRQNKTEEDERWDSTEGNRRYNDKDNRNNTHNGNDTWDDTQGSNSRSYGYNKGDSNGYDRRGGRRQYNKDESGNYKRKNNYNDDENNDDGDQNDRGNRGPRRGGRGGGRGRGGGEFGRNNGSGRDGGDYGRNRGGDDFDKNNGGGRDGGDYGRNRGGDNFGKNNGRARRMNGGDSEEDSGNKDSNNDETQTKPREIYIPPEQSTDENSLFGNEVTMGINFDKYDEIEVKVSGDNVPTPINSFEEAGLRTLLLENIQKSGYKKPTPVQKNAIPIIMNKRDLMACAQTGSGKTAAFVLPIINVLLEDPTDLIMTSSTCEPQAIIISPTRELTIQIYQQVLKFSLRSIIRAQVVYGGTSVRYQSDKVLAGCHILVATPGRLLDFVRRDKIKFSSLRFLVLDEADRMLDMGFLPDIEKIFDHETMMPQEDRQTLMFSATFPAEIQSMSGRFLRNYLFLTVGIIGAACADVEQNFHQTCGQPEKRKLLKEIIEKQNQIGSIEGTLVFVEMKRHADFIAAFLSENNFPTTSIHGDRLQREREEALQDFKRGKMSILVATEVAARGLDIKNVSHVINFDLPKSIDGYVHRIGRTGRVGNRGKATSFFNPDTDEPLTGHLIRILRQAGQPVPDWLESGGGGGSRTFGSSRESRLFGGEDIRQVSNIKYPGQMSLVSYDNFCFKSE